MDLAKNIKKHRDDWGLMQMEVANAIGAHSNYNLPKQAKVEDKTATEKIQVISPLVLEGKNADLRVIYGMRTKNKIQTIFEQNIQTAK